MKELKYSISSFSRGLEKIAEKEKEKSLGNRFKESIPWILGMGAGSVAAEVLATQLREKSGPGKHQAIKNVARIALPLTGAVLMNTVIPQLQAKFRKSMMANEKTAAIAAIAKKFHVRKAIGKALNKGAIKRFDIKHTLNRKPHVAGSLGTTRLVGK